MMSNEFCVGEPPYHYGGGEGSGECGIRGADWGAADGEFSGHGYGCGECDNGAGGGTFIGTGYGYGTPWN